MKKVLISSFDMEVGGVERSLISMLENFDYEYLILGQHYVDDGAEKEHVMRGDGDALLTKYVDTVIAGINTGKFSYVAHPDVVNYTGDDDFYKAEMKRLCLAAKAKGLPLELNCVGVMKNRCYPNDKFWRIAGEVHNSVIIGVDAHNPAQLQDPLVWDTAMYRLTSLGHHLVNNIRKE